MAISPPRPSRGGTPPRLHRPDAGEFIALDIETCPLWPDDVLADPTETLADSLVRRLHLGVANVLDADPNLDAVAARRKAASLHPGLGFVCCIGVVRGTLDGTLNAPRSWVAGSPEAEAAMLREVFVQLNRFARGIRWVTFNGKRFDVPFLKTRLVHHNLALLAPTNGLFDTYPFNTKPHADLAKVLEVPLTLAGLCDLLGVPTSKGAMSGADVAEAVREGRLDEVRRYCEADVVATARCAQAMPALL